MSLGSIVWIVDFVSVMIFVMPFVTQLNCSAVKASSRSSITPLNLVLPDLSIRAQ